MDEPSDFNVYVLCIILALVMFALRLLNSVHDLLKIAHRCLNNLSSIIRNVNNEQSLWVHKTIHCHMAHYIPYSHVIPLEHSPNTWLNQPHL